MAVLATLVLSLWGALANYSSESDFDSQAQNRDPYMVQGAGDRLAALRQALPDNAVLGYMSDAGGTLATVLYDTAQYSLAPRLLEKSTSADLVLGNFTRPADFAGLGSSYGLKIEHDFGNGVILYRRSRE